MRVCVVGAGAVGGHLAARLDASDAEVSIVARGATLTAIRAEGLRAELAEGTVITHPAVTDRVEDLPRQDLVVVAVKAPSLPSIAAEVGALLADDGMALFVVNGIPWWYGHPDDAATGAAAFDRLDPSRSLATHVGVERVVGGVAYTAGSVVEPGVVRATNARNRLVLGRPDGRPDVRIHRIAAAFRAGGLEVSETTRIREAVWAKLALNLVGGSLAVLSGAPMQRVLALPGVMRTAEEMTQEAAAIARALGCDAGDVEAGLARLATSSHLQSIAQDLQAGRAMEVDAMLRVPLELARSLGVETPRLGPVVELAIERARSAGCYDD